LNANKTFPARQVLLPALSCSFQNWNFVCGQSWNGSKDGTMEEDDGFGLWIGGLLEVIDVAVRPETTDDGGTWRGGNDVAVGAGGDFAVVANADAGLLTPDKRPPRTSWGGPQDGAFFGASLGLGHLWGGAEFAVDFVLVGVDQELVEQPVGGFEFEDMIGGEQWRQAFLPVVVAAFDFAFGLRGWGVEEFDAVEVKGLAELGEGIGIILKPAVEFQPVGAGAG
jgi:hypothetical protein